MTWQEHHTASQELAVLAHDLVRSGNPDAAATFLEAARRERLALEALGADKVRTIGVTAISAASLFYKAKAYDQAAILAHEMLLRQELPVFARQELRQILQSIWNEEAQREANRVFSGSQILVSIRGGQVLTGGAPMDILLSKVQGIQSFVVRVAELLSELPLRLQGPPTQSIGDSYRPWLFQSPPGSYQFSVAIESPRQGDMFPVSNVSGTHVTEKFLNILRSACETPEIGLADVVGDEGYRRTFLKLTRNLAPTGKTIEEIAITGTRSDRPVLMSSNSRKELGAALRKLESSFDANEEVAVNGVLRALDLDRDWLDVGDGVQSTRIYGVAEAVDDVIGPMVNQRVSVRARQVSKQRLSFIDIELDE